MNNGTDPLTQVPDHARLLFERFAAASEGFPADAVAGAALNLLINALRQRHGTWQQAEQAFDEYLGKSKQILKDCYGMSGRRNGIFPFDQTIAIDLLDENAKRKL
jgi:hypothetical protein